MIETYEFEQSFLLFMVSVHFDGGLSFAILLL